MANLRDSIGKAKHAEYIAKRKAKADAKAKESTSAKGSVSGKDSK